MGLRVRFRDGGYTGTINRVQGQYIWITWDDGDPEEGPFTWADIEVHTEDQA